jgi:hypothetical protein
MVWRAWSRPRFTKLRWMVITRAFYSDLNTERLRPRRITNPLFHQNLQTVLAET